MIVKIDIVNYYTDFYRKKYSNKNYLFIPSFKADKTIDIFLLQLDKEYKLSCIGNNFLIRYFNFQFNRLDGLVFKRFASEKEGGKVQIYDVVGKKAFKYWLDRDIGFDFKIHNISFNKVDLNILSKAEEIEKNRFVNTNRGQLNCIEKTSLFNHKSSICLLCMYKNDCKQLLKNNYINIFTKRGY